MTLTFTAVITLLQEREREKKSSDVEATLRYDNLIDAVSFVTHIIHSANFRMTPVHIVQWSRH